jgi:hypothetical protein
MHIYLKHPVHGCKVAISDMEAIYDASNGWVRYNPETPSLPDEAVTMNELIVTKRKYIRKADKVETEGV